MKLFIKENFLYFVSFFVCLSVIFFQYYSSISSWEKAKNIRQQWYDERCYEYNVEDYKNIIHDDPYDNKQSCATQYEYLNQGVEDTYYIFFSTFNEGPPIFIFFSILFVIVPAIYYFHQKMKKGNLKNILTREKYLSFLKKEYFKSLKAIFIVPICMLVLFICAYLYSGHFDVNKTLILTNGELGFEYNNHFTIVYFMIIFFVNIIIQSVFYINLAYLIDKKNKNILLTYIETFLVFLGIQLILEIFKDIIFYEIFNIRTFPITLFDIWSYVGADKFMLIPILMNLFLTLITSYFVYKIYSNKEKVLISNE